MEPLALRVAFFMSTIDTPQHIWWDDGGLCLLDQRLLPGEELTVRCRTLDDVILAIKSMQVRGAPAIGCTAAYGMVIAFSQSKATAPSQMLGDLAAAKALLDAARPTAVNLAWATERMLRAAEHRMTGDNDESYAALLDEAPPARLRVDAPAVTQLSSPATELSDVAPEQATLPARTAPGRTES